MVTSAAYRQSATVTPQKIDKDRDNADKDTRRVQQKVLVLSSHLGSNSIQLITFIHKKKSCSIFF